MAISSSSILLPTLLLRWIFLKSIVIFLGSVLRRENLVRRRRGAPPSPAAAAGEMTLALDKAIAFIVRRGRESLLIRWLVYGWSVGGMEWPSCVTENRCLFPPANRDPLPLPIVHSNQQPINNNTGTSESQYRSHPFSILLPNVQVRRSGRHLNGRLLHGQPRSLGQH